MTDAPDEVSKAVSALRDLVGTNQVMAYLVMMAARLVELHRVLKPTGSLYLHCDPTSLTIEGLLHGAEVKMPPQQWTSQHVTFKKARRARLQGDAQDQLDLG